MTRRFPWLLVGLLWLSGCAAREAPKTVEFDVQREVLPIFKARCWSCHGPGQQQGGLRLDDKAHALQGGFSGKTLAGKSIDDSELLRRVTSDDVTIAMPKEGGRLSDQEVATLRRWIELRTPWPDQQPPSGPHEFATRYSDDLWGRLSVVGREIKVYLLLGFAILMGLADRIRRIPADNARWSSGFRHRIWRVSQRVSASLFLFVLLSASLWEAIEFSMRQSAKLASTEEKLNSTVAASQPRAASGSAPMPYRLPGTPQWGGTYYRGNDERNEKLFNGGYYRTATLRLSLTDEEDRPVPQKEPLTGSRLFIRLEIERASHSTPSLFTDQIMANVLLTRRTSVRKAPLSADVPTKLETLEPGERWAAKYRLGDYDGEADAALNGVVYVTTNAMQGGEAVHGTIHYGIVYGVRIHNRVLLENSELWLGPILVPGNFQIPDPHQLTLAEWLDVRPIPEIEGENSTDPKLLGIPEHLPSAK